MSDDEPKKPRPSPVACYSFLVVFMTNAARQVGYAVAVHGSMHRDLDILAAPWTDDAKSPEELVKAVVEAIGFEMPAHANVVGPTSKPHGRVAYFIPLGVGAGVDLSIMPRR